MTSPDMPSDAHGDNLPWLDLGGSAVAVDCGWDFSCAIMQSGGKKCWVLGSILLRTDREFGRPSRRDGHRSCRNDRAQAGL